MIEKKKYKIFWKSKINLLKWFKKPTKIVTYKDNNFKNWYEDGKLNLSFECIDNNIQRGLGNKKALIFIDSNNKLISLTYNKLFDCVERFSYILKNKYKINSKKKILIHASASFESVISMLSCARLGSCHSVVFQDLQESAMTTRIKLFNPDLIITRDNDENIRNKILKSKYKINLKKKILIFRNSKTNLNCYFCDTLKILNNNSLKKLNKKYSFNSTKKLFTLFTSGIIHSFYING